MTKMKIILILVLSLAGMAQAGDLYWGNASGDWSSANTWAETPAYRDVPSPIYVAGDPQWQDIAITIGDVTINVTTDGQGAVDLMGGYHTGNGILNVAAGKHLQITHTAQVGCGNDADAFIASLTVNVYGSFFSEQLRVGDSLMDSGIVNVYDGGSLDVGTGGCTVGKYSATTGTGKINLIGGTMTVSSAVTINPKGLINIEKGQLKVIGDKRTTLQGYINDGKITSFGGKFWRCVPKVTYESGWTYVRTSGGCVCESYPEGDFNHDCYVDFADLSFLADSWLDCTNPADANCSQVYLSMSDTTLRMRHYGQSFDISLNCPKFIFNIATTAEGIAPISIVGDISSGEVVTVYYSPVGLNGFVTLEPQLLLQWSPEEKIVRKWAHYRLTGNINNVVLQEIVLESVDRNLLLGDPIIWVPQSYPVFINAFFMGIEFPAASTRVEGQKLIMGHRPGLRPISFVWYDSRKAIYGAAAPGRERDTFKDYITSHRPQPTGLHINYCSWWTSPWPKYSEADILAIMQQFKDNLTTPYGVSFDTFTIDDGWANNQSIWEINASKFPNGFTNLQSYAQSMGSSLGLWNSPSAMYPNSLDTTWAMNNGYETYNLPWTPYSKLCCIAGQNYNTAYRNKLVGYANLYGVKHYKIDGYNLTCSASSHGHEPNELSADATAQGGINVFQAIHAASPHAWLEGCGCFSWNPSPWWLFYVNNVTSPYGDDSPTGRVPCPIYRESYTTARDFYNFQGATYSAIPANAQEILGLVHQSTEPFLNDGVMVVMRGHGFMPLYINPAYMSGRWSALAQLLTWARNNSGTVLANTYPLIPASWENGGVPKYTHVGVMPRDIYGYAHCVNNQGLVVLRNPWLAPQTYNLKVDESIGFDSLAAGLSAVSLYPENRVYGQNLQHGSTITFTVAPYETVVLSIGSGYNLSGIPTVGNSIGGKIQTNITQSSATTDLIVSLQATVDTNAPQTKLLVVMEGTAALADPTYQLLVNGSPASVTTISSENGWSSTGLAEREHWKFLQVDLTSSHSTISLQQLHPDANCTKVSIWAWATKSGSGTPSFPNSLPSPELINLDAALLGNFNR